MMLVLRPGVPQERSPVAIICFLSGMTAQEGAYYKMGAKNIGACWPREDD
jgi:hypothetical protein